MNQILIYTRKNSSLIEESSEILAAHLRQVGFNPEITFSTNIARIILNNYYVIHLMIEKWPLTLNELLLVSVAKSMNKSTVLSLFNLNTKQINPFFHLTTPDALTVSQTNQFQFFRNWKCSKSVLPLIPKLKSPEINNDFSLNKNLIQIQTALEKKIVLIPLQKHLNETLKFNSLSEDETIEVYFDVRLLLNKMSSTKIRKQWLNLNKKDSISNSSPTLNNFHLVFSDEKISDLLNADSLIILLSNPQLNPIELTQWFKIGLNKGHYVILNQSQATGFSFAWKTEMNSIVVNEKKWIDESIEHIKNSKSGILKSNFDESLFIDPLINDLSRLYTKIYHQRTSLISNDNANDNSTMNSSDYSNDSTKV